MSSEAASPQRVVIEIPRQAEFVRVVRLAVSGVASRLAFSYDEIEDIKLAVTEACNNAIVHAGDTPDEARVTVVCSPRDESLEIDVIDCGPGIEPDDLAQPHAPGMDEGGLGFVLIQALMDAVEVKAVPGGGACVHMVKRLAR